VRTLAIGSWAVKPFGLQLASRCLRQQVRRPVVWFSPRTASSTRPATHFGLGSATSDRGMLAWAGSANLHVGAADGRREWPKAATAGPIACSMFLMPRPFRPTPAMCGYHRDDRHVSNRPALQPLQRTLRAVAVQPLQRTAASRCSAAVAADGCEPSDRLAPVGLPTRPQVDYPNLSKMCTDLEAAIKVRASPRACGTHSQQLSRRLLSSERHAVCMCNHHRCGRCKHTR
jgi:hypothetical protein